MVRGADRFAVVPTPSTIVIDSSGAIHLGPPRSCTSSSSLPRAFSRIRLGVRSRRSPPSGSLSLRWRRQWQFPRHHCRGPAVCGAFTGDSLGRISDTFILTASSSASSPKLPPERCGRCWHPAHRERCPVRGAGTARWKHRGNTNSRPNPKRSSPSSRVPAIVFVPLIIVRRFRREPRPFWP